MAQFGLEQARCDLRTGRGCEQLARLAAIGAGDTGLRTNEKS
jgi:hypothetical protein